jgi:hypothetical protein
MIVYTYFISNKINVKVFSKNILENKYIVETIKIHKNIIILKRSN